MTSKCQERYVKTSGKISWMDKKTGQQKEKFIMYLRIQEDFKNFGRKRLHHWRIIGVSFVFEKIKIDEITKRELTKEDLEFLTSLGIN